MLVLAACGDGLAGPPTTPPDLLVVASADSVFVGDSVRMTVSARVDGSSAGSLAARWTSSDTAVARVDAQGWVRTRREGSVVITAEALGARADAPLRVRALPVPATVRLAASSETLYEGGSVQLEAVVTSQYGEPLRDARLAWSSSDPAVAAVDSAGRVRGVAPGSVTVSATAGAARAEVRVDVVEAMTMRQLIGGARHSCGIDTDGAAWCWGYNTFASVGNGRSGTERVRTPERVLGGQRFVRLRAGVFHTCGITATGEAWCWGDDARGQLGAPASADCGGSSPCSPVPVQVRGAPALASVAPGFDHTCALTPAGAAWCWGFNASGELGIDDTTVVSSMTAREVVGGLRFAQVVSGDAHSCALTAAGEAWCWGDHYWGQLGDSTPSGNARNGLASSPRPRRVAGGHRFTVLAAYAASTCGITDAGAAWCWGFNARYWNGQTRDPNSVRSYMESSFPIPVVGATGLGPDLLEIGDLLQCGRAVAGGLLCWGVDMEQALTTGQSRILLPATRVLPDVEWRQLSTGGAHLCGTTTSGSARCFGFNGDGALGDGTTTSRVTPAPPYGMR